MSFGVCLHFEMQDRDVWSGRQTDLDAWRYALKAFGGDRLAVIDLVPDESIAVQDETIVFERYFSLADFEAAYSRETLVYVENDPSGVSLADFEHPADCWYVFGSTQGLDVTEKTSVIVEQAVQTVVMHAVHLAPIVLWDRFRKIG